MERLDEILAYRGLDSAGLTNKQKHLVKATVIKMDYKIIWRH